MIENKTCINCGKIVKGRSDKKFCDDYCRNNFNNQQKAVETNLMRNIINAIRKNRNILQAILGNEEMTKTTKERLLAKGFQFKYHTHTYDNKKGGTYFYCFEYGYLPLDNDWFLVVKTKSEKE